MKTIYLAGPISGLSYDQATNGWRRRFEIMVEHLLGDEDFGFIRCASPMRGKDFLADTEKLGHRPEEMHGYANPMASPSGIVTRDHHDVRTCDVILANFLEAEAVSIGTVLEIGMAFNARKPIIAVVPPGDHPHRHGMLLAMVQANGYIVHSLEEAASILYHLLVPGV